MAASEFHYILNEINVVLLQCGCRSRHCPVLLATLLSSLDPSADATFSLVDNLILTIAVPHDDGTVGTMRPDLRPVRKREV